MPLSGKKKWKEKVFTADKIWNQVKNILSAEKLELPETPRRPDVRLIVNNISGVDRVFKNPGNHSADLAEHIPAAGDQTAVMVMLKGDTLEEQYANAKTLYDWLDLGNKGLSDEFLTALKDGSASELVKEAYGPAPFKGQSEKLVDVDWDKEDGEKISIKPVFGEAASFGTRKIDAEKVLALDVEMFVQGTDSVPERIEDTIMYVAVSSDWQTGEEKTRPIVASVAPSFYGAHTPDIPSVTLGVDGKIRDVDLKNGNKIELYETSNLQQLRQA